MTRIVVELPASAWAAAGADAGVDVVPGRRGVRVALERDQALALLERLAASAGPGALDRATAADRIRAALAESGNTGGC
jgi:hypothetical protein